MMMKHILSTVLILAAGYACRAQQERKIAHSIEITPLSNYIGGRNIKAAYHLRYGSSEFYGGIATHINTFRDEQSITQDYTVNNGVAEQFKDYLHLNIGYEKLLFKGRVFRPLVFADLLAGSIALSNRFYYGYDEINGVKYDASILHPQPHNDRATFYQYALGIGCKIYLNKSFVLSNRIGVARAQIRRTIIDNGFEYIDKYSDGFVYPYHISLAYFF